MSRIGRLPIELPANVSAVVNPGNEVTIKGPKGELKKKFSNKVGISLEGNVITVTRVSDEKQIKALHGMTRAMIANMARGVSEGFTKELEIVGVGYRAQLSGKKLVLNIQLKLNQKMELPLKFLVKHRLSSRVLINRWSVRLRQTFGRLNRRSLIRVKVFAMQANMLHLKKANLVCKGGP